MKQLLVGNAPCSWGMLEFEEAKGEPIRFPQMLDELAQAGYTGTELGDWGYMPTDSGALRQELVDRRLTMLGAFVPVALKDAAQHQSGIENAVKTATLLKSVAGSPAPYLVLADANGTDARRTEFAGRVPPEAGLTPEQWDVFADGANRIARAVRERTGLRTVFHHHCAGYVETPFEIERLLALTDPDLLGLVFDTGHFVYGSGTNTPNMITFLDGIAERVWYVHCKDCSPGVAEQARRQHWDYFTALRHGVFCELGQGAVNFPALLNWLKAREYGGYVVVEQDVLPGLGSPYESARRNREYLRSIESRLSAL